MAIQARIALSGAAERAVTLGAHDQAVAYYRQAIEITADPGERAALHLHAAASADAASMYDLAAELVRTGVELALAAGDTDALGACEALYGEILIDSGQTLEAVELLEAAAARPAAAIDETVMAELLGNLSRAYMRAGQPAKSVETADRALVVAERHHLDRIIAETFNNKGSSLSFMGRQLEGIALLRAAVDLAHDRGYVAAEIRARQNLAASMDGDPRLARDQLELAFGLARRVGNRTLASWTAISRLYSIYGAAEGWDAALADVEQDLVESAAIGLSPLDELRSLLGQAMIRTARGESTDEMLARMTELADQTSDAFGAAGVEFVRGDRALLAGRYAESCSEMLAGSTEPNLAELMLARAGRAAVWGRDHAGAVDVVERLDAHPGSVRSTVAARSALRAGIAALEGRRDEAIAAYRDAVGRYRAAGEDLELACVGLDFVALVGPDEPTAYAAAIDSRAIFERVGARPYLERLDAALARPSAEGSRPTATAADLVSPTAG